MPDPLSFDVLVIGAGPAGVNAASTAALFGKKVAIVEKTPAVGGAGANTGTLPSKTLRETALTLSGMKARRLYGVDLSLKRQATVTELLFHERMVKHAEQAQITGLLDRLGVPVLFGAARFVGPHTVSVSTPTKQDDVTVTADKVILAIGSAPVRPPLFPFDHPRVLDSDEVVELHEVPKSLAVIGAGVIGSEYACTFAALGCEVDLIDGRDTLLPFLDLEVSAALTQAMADLGVRFRWGEQATACAVRDGENGGVTLTLTSGATVEADAVLVAAGRSSHTDALNPEAAGLLVGKRGLLAVDKQFRTNVPHVYAAGDVIGFPALASTSAEQGRAAACHACGSDVYNGLPPLLPTGVYTIPEVGCVGETEGTLKAHGIEYVVGRATYAENPRGKIIGDTTGFLKLLFRKSDMALVGVHVIGEQATEVVHIGLMAMRAGGRAAMLVHTCFNYPTLGGLYKRAAIDAVLNRYGRLDAIPPGDLPDVLPPTAGG